MKNVSYPIEIQSVILSKNNKLNNINTIQFFLSLTT